MSRTMKRVPMDFDWPLGKIWQGYLDPWYQYASDCEECKGSGLGYNKKTAQLAANFYNYSSETGDGWSNKITQEEVDHLLEKGRLTTFVRDVETNKGKWKKLPRTAAEVNDKENHGMGSHDAINRGYLIEFRARKLGFYGLCENCDGNATIWYGGVLKDGKTAEQLSEEWEPTEPPVGEGYQLWSTTSEGEPSSPIFESVEELAEWCESNATTFASYRASKEAWLEMIKKDNVHHDTGTGVVFL